MSKTSDEGAENQWPPMAESEYDEDGYSMDGTTPISIVSIAAYGANNKPVPRVRSAGCAYCNRWAVDFYLGVARTSDGEMRNTVERRAEFSLIYFCDRHRDDAAEELLEKYGAASNMLDMDLAQKVSDFRAACAAEGSA